jgi:hypothetical protein
MSRYAVTGLPYQPPQPSALELAHASGREAEDPELVSLPRARDPRRAMTLLVLALGVAAAVTMVAALARDVAYAFASTNPVALGDLRTVSSTTLAVYENRKVTADGPVGAADAVRYERALREDTFRVLPVLGRVDLWVEVRVPLGNEGGRWEPPRSFTGRLEKLDATGPARRGLKDAIEEATHARIPRDAWLIVDGEEPASVRLAVVLWLGFLACAIGNALAMVRIVRKVGA